MRHLLIGGIAVAALAAFLVRPAIGDSILYSLAWWTVDNGGYISSGTAASGVAYTLTSTIGQPDAGWMAGGNYSLAGGFWGAAAPPRFVLYLPMVKRD